MLYRGEYENLGNYPKPGCRLTRYIIGSDSIPARIVRHFLLIPRLVRMYQSPVISKLLQYHSDLPNTDDGVMKSVVDSLA
jgi:hypothetical protein